MPNDTEPKTRIFWRRPPIAPLGEEADRILSVGDKLPSVEVDGFVASDYTAIELLAVRKDAGEAIFTVQNRSGQYSFAIYQGGTIVLVAAKRSIPAEAGPNSIVLHLKSLRVETAGSIKVRIRYAPQDD